MIAPSVPVWEEHRLALCNSPAQNQTTCFQREHLQVVGVFSSSIRLDPETKMTELPVRNPSTRYRLALEWGYRTQMVNTHTYSITSMTSQNTLYRVIPPHLNISKYSVHFGQNNLLHNLEISPHNHSYLAVLRESAAPL